MLAKTDALACGYVEIFSDGRDLRRGPTPCGLGEKQSALSGKKMAYPLRGLLQGRLNKACMRVKDLPQIMEGGNRWEYVGKSV